MKILKNKTAAVTGVTSGLGRMLAVRLAGTGATILDCLMRLMPVTTSIVNGAVSRRIAKAYADR